MLDHTMADAPLFSWIKLALVVGTLAYVGLLLFAMLFANRLLLPAPAPGYRDGPGIDHIPWNEAGETVAVQFLPVTGSRYLIFYHHGNAEDLQSIQPRLHALREAGFSVLAWDYPGYGTSGGKASPQRILKSAEAVWMRIPEMYGFSHDTTLLYGRSVGGGPATWLASRHAPAGLILESTFTSVFRVVFPFPLLPWDIFNNLDQIDRINTPLLVMHGTADSVVPFSHGSKLHELARQPKFFTWFDEGGHNDLVESFPEIYRSSLHRFVEEISSEP